MIKNCYWEITKKCNLFCVHCISANGAGKELNTCNIFKVIDILSNWGCKEIYLTGGEPLMRGDIFKILHKIKRKDIKLGLLTNGILVDKKNIREIKKYVDEIGVSLDGSSPAVNDKIRGDGSFVKILAAISLIKQYEIPLTLFTTLNKVNYTDFENILRLATVLGVNNVKANQITLRGRAAQHKYTLRVSAKNTEKYVLTVLRKKFKRSVDGLFLDNECDVDCKTIFLSPSGNIYPCIEIFHQKPRCHLGNILKFELKDYIKYKHTISKRKEGNCPYKFIVKGNVAVCVDIPLAKCNFFSKR